MEFGLYVEKFGLNVVKFVGNIVKLGLCCVVQRVRCEV